MRVPQRPRYFPVFGGNPTSHSLHQNDLNPFHKLLFQLTWRFVLPRDSKRTQASLMDLSIMYCLAKKIKINFPSLMIIHLTHCITHKNRVGYGSLLTYIFRKCKVKLPSHPSFELEPENFLTEETLSWLSLSVVGGKIDFEGKKQEEKGKGKEEEQAQSVSRRIKASKSLRNKGESGDIFVDLEEDMVPLESSSKVVDFPLLSSAALFSFMREIQGLIGSVDQKIQGLETRLMHFEMQHDRLLDAM